MFKAHYEYRSICSKLALLILITCSSSSYAAAPDNPVMSEDTTVMKSPVSQAGVLMLAEDDSASKVPSGTLIIPGEEQAMKSEKKCVRVCDKWGGPPKRYPIPVIVVLRRDS